MTSKENHKRLKKEGWILEGQTVPHPKKYFSTINPPNSIPISLEIDSNVFLYANIT